MSNATAKAAACAVAVLLARAAARSLDSLAERTHSETARRLAAQLAEELPVRTMLGAHVLTVGGPNWRNVADAMIAARARNNPALYERALQVIAAEVTDDPRLDEARATELIRVATAHLSHVANSGRKRSDFG